MGSAISPELRGEVNSFIRSVIDCALGGPSQDGPSPIYRASPVLDGEARTTALASICASISDEVQSTLRAHIGVHNNTVPLNELPPEILCAIFEKLAFPDRLAASHVCQRWRLVAISHAQLWSEHLVSHVGDESVLQFLFHMLARTKNAPLNVDITFRLKYRQLGVRPSSAAPEDIAEFSEALLEHLHHTRNLAVQVELHAALSHVWFMLQHPAPLMKTLELSVVDLVRAGRLSPRLPEDLFAGDAPLLERAVLHRVQIPPSGIPAFSALQMLAISLSGNVDSDSLLRLVESAPRLRKLALVLGVGHRDISSDVTFRTGIETLYAEGGRAFRDEELLRVMNLFLEVNSNRAAIREVGLSTPTVHELNWLLSRGARLETLAAVSRTGFDFTLTAWGATETDITHRAWQLHSHHIDAILDRPGLFDHLRSLTLAEAVWSESLCAVRPQMPSVPRLEHLTLVLATEPEYFDGRGSWGDSFAGLFHLDLSSGDGSDSESEWALEPWDCPALRTLRLMSAAVGGARVAEEDVRFLLLRHLYAPSIQRLEMLRVELYSATTLLHGHVEEVVYLADDEFDRVWPTFFPDLGWAGAVGRHPSLALE